MEPRANGGRARPRRADALALALCLAATAAAYAPALEGGFVWDDRTLVAESPLVREGAPLREYFLRAFWDTPLGEPVRSFYRPLVVLSYRFDWWRGGGDPAAFHATNLALHALAVALLFAWLRALGLGPAGAGLGAAWFALFPRCTQSVAWIAGRTDPLAVAAGAAALLVHHRGRGRPAARAATAALLGLGLLAKEVAVAFFAALGAYELARARRAGRWPDAREALRLGLPLGAVLLAYATVRLAAGTTNEDAPALGAGSAPRRCSMRSASTRSCTWTPSGRRSWWGSCESSSPGRWPRAPSLSRRSRRCTRRRGRGAGLRSRRPRSSRQPSRSASSRTSCRFPSRSSPWTTTCTPRSGAGRSSPAGRSRGPPSACGAPRWRRCSPRSPSPSRRPARARGSGTTSSPSGRRRPPTRIR